MPPVLTRPLVLGEGDRAAQLALTIQIVAKRSPGRRAGDDSSWAIAQVR